MAATKAKTSPGTIALNKRAKFDYQLHERFEAGLVLTGWEMKSIRAGKVQLTDTYVFLKNGEAFLLACNITPLLAASTHVIAEPMRSRKLLHAQAGTRAPGHSYPTKGPDLRCRRHVLERPSRQTRGRPGYWQKRVRQARHPQRPGLEPR